jgi:hypothetical protein
LNLENDLKDIERKYRERGIESPQLEKIFNEQFIQMIKALKGVDIMRLKIFEEKNGKISVAEAKYSFTKALMNIFKDLPMPENEFVNYGEKAKQDEIEKLRQNVINDDVFHNLKNELTKLLNEVFNDFKIFNTQLTAQTNKERTYDIFLSYHRQGNGTNIKLFRDRLIKSGFSVWHDDICLPCGYGQDYQGNLIKGIENSKVFLFIWNKGYSGSDNCMKEFNWAVSRGEKKIKIVALELEKIDDKIILFNLRNKFNPKIYKFQNAEISQIPEENFFNLTQSIKKLIN